MFIVEPQLTFFAKITAYIYYKREITISLKQT